MKNKNSKRGQGVMEYLIISSLIGIICIAAVTSLGKTIKEKIYDMRVRINQTINI